MCVFNVAHAPVLSSSKVRRHSMCLCKAARLLQGHDSYNFRNLSIFYWCVHSFLLLHLLHLFLLLLLLLSSSTLFHFCMLAVMLDRFFFFRDKTRRHRWYYLAFRIILLSKRLSIAIRPLRSLHFFTPRTINAICPIICSTFYVFIRFTYRYFSPVTLDDPWIVHANMFYTVSNQIFLDIFETAAFNNVTYKICKWFIERTILF